MYEVGKTHKLLTIQGRLKLDNSRASTTSTAGSRRLVAVGMQERMRTGTCGDAHLSCTMVLSSVMPLDTANIRTGHGVKSRHMDSTMGRTCHQPFSFLRTDNPNCGTLQDLCEM